MSKWEILTIFAPKNLSQKSFPLATVDGRDMHVLRTYEHIQVVTPLTIAEIPQLMAPKDVSLMSLTTMTISAVLSELSKD